MITQAPDLINISHEIKKTLTLLYYVLLGWGGGYFFIAGVLNARCIHMPYDCNTARIFSGRRGGPRDNFFSWVPGTEVFYFIYVNSIN